MVPALGEWPNQREFDAIDMTTENSTAAANAMSKGPLKPF